MVALQKSGRSAGEREVTMFPWITAIYPPHLHLHFSNLFSLMASGLLLFRELHLSVISYPRNMGSLMGNSEFFEFSFYHVEVAVAYSAGFDFDEYSIRVGFRGFHVYVDEWKVFNFVYTCA
jgi:hypothetical protein